MRKASGGQYLRGGRIVFIAPGKVHRQRRPLGKGYAADMPAPPETDVLAVEARRAA
jgi:hypothetical protein